jgi:hypothetical protein
MPPTASLLLSPIKLPPRIEPSVLAPLEVCRPAAIPYAYVSVCNQVSYMTAAIHKRMPLKQHHRLESRALVLKGLDAPQKKLLLLGLTANNRQTQ